MKEKLKTEYTKKSVLKQIIQKLEGADPDDTTKILIGVVKEPGDCFNRLHKQVKSYFDNLTDKIEPALKKRGWRISYLWPKTQWCKKYACCAKIDDTTTCQVYVDVVGVGSSSESSFSGSSSY